MGATIARFFRDVFGATAGDPSAWASAAAGDPALPWSNYFVARPTLWADLAKFDVLAAAWLDATFPRAVVANATCPATYAGLEARGVLATAAVHENCRYCRTAAWTNFHRCRVGCHRCWSYVLEQLNVIFFRVFADLRYVHDEAACAAPRPWRPPAVAGAGDFDRPFLRRAYAALLDGGASP